MLNADMVADSMKHVQLSNVKAQDSKKDLDLFFEVLKSNNTKSIGGKVPDDGFYY